MIHDFEARQRALDPTQSFIVQAPAGSGKTGLLVYRLLRLLACVEQPQQVLAITFTRKATAEMRARLMELLMAADQGTVAHNPFEQQGVDLAKAVLQRDQERQWGLMDAPHQVQIQTIDSFCAKLTASMPWLSRLGDRPRATDDASAHYAAAVEQLFEELLDSESSIASSLRAVMLALDFNYDKARQLFSSMLARRDQWLRHLVLNDLSAMQEEVNQAWAGINAQAVKKLRQLIPDALLQEVMTLGIEAAQNLAATPDSSDELSALLTVQPEMPYGTEVWQAVCNLFLTKSGGWRKVINKNLGFLPKVASTERMKQILNDHADDAQLCQALRTVRELPATALSDGDWQQLRNLEAVLTYLAGLLQLRFRAAGECDHSEVTQRANLALRELDNPTDLGLRMDYHLQHILVDEFQDTAHGQIELLKRLTDGWESGKTLFLVGDPMQSIYRFREADVSLFMQVTRNQSTGVFPNLTIEPLTLTENFRSSAGLVTWFNQTFTQSFPAAANIISGAIPYSKATSSSDNDTPAVRCLLASDTHQQASLVQEQVGLALQSSPPTAQIAILVRTRGQLSAILPALRDAGIAYTGVDIQPLKELPAVLDVLALCKAICRRDDRTAWLALLRGPWVGMTLSEITMLAGNPDYPVWDQIKDAELNVCCEHTQVRLSYFISVMRNVLAQRQQVSLAALSRWAWQQLGGEATLFTASESDIDTVFELIESLQRGADLPSMRDLETALDKLYARAQAEGSDNPRVVVSTMHKAKGLQYHTVILPALSSTPRADDRDVLMWTEHSDEQGNSALLLAPYSMTQDSGSHYDYLRRLEAERSKNEAVRLMYVACTRAEQHLILIATAKISEKTGDINPPSKNTLLATVWDALNADFNLLSQPDTMAHETSELPQSLPRLIKSHKPRSGASIDWQVPARLHADPEPPEEQMTFEWATEVATGVGIVLHEWLQYNQQNLLEAVVDESLRQRWRAELLALRVPQARLSAAVKRLEEAVDRIQQDQSAHFLFQDYAISDNEYALSAFEDGVVNTYRIDRTFVDQSGVRWIVDYKSTDTNRVDLDAFIDEQVQLRHRPQLEKYGALMREIDARPIKLAVYFPLLRQLRVWEYVDSVDH
ncbi:ATP-dependent helicase [Arenicella chitinivorans]|uniref:DNA 3'-5' helicase n=1 Tax=Arenicella chitinivorans TaxID=1329800 RepID=A0A918VNA5_9GAMM|nr:UvrD-helicase domain-containing protein [Arenicella chitinivorans]GHA10246.1 ATP-dependent helicase [Arenicella chitinivorans]